MALKFNGTTDYLQTILDSGIGLPLSFCMFANQTAFGNGDNSWLCVHNNQTGSGMDTSLLRLSGVSDSAVIYDDSSTQAAGSVAGPSGYAITDRWLFCAGTSRSDGTSRYAYVNGVAGSQNTTNSDPANMTYIDIGRGRDFSGTYLSGQRCAWCAVWNAELTGCEVVRLYNNGVPLDPRNIRPDSLVGFWPLRNDLLDYSGNGHHMTVAAGAPTWYRDPQVMPYRRRVWRPQWSSAPAGSVTVTPDPATAVAASVNPTVVLGSVTVPPDPVTVIAATVNPVVILGSVTVPPDPATAVAARVDPTVQITGGGGTPTDTSRIIAARPWIYTAPVGLSDQAKRQHQGWAYAGILVGGGVQVIPSPATAAVTSVSPTVVYGSITVTPAALTAACAVAGPTISGGGVTVTPAASTAATSVIAPTVIRGSITVTPAAINSAASVAGPVVIRGSLTLSGIASAAARVSGPVIAGAGVTVSPTAVIARTRAVINRTHRIIAFVGADNRTMTVSASTRTLNVKPDHQIGA